MDLFQDMLRDVRCGLRTLAKKPTFTVVAVAVLALGIGANTTIFSLANALLLEQILADEPDRLVTIHGVYEDGSSDHAFSYPDYQAFRDDNPVFSEMVAWTNMPVSLSFDGEARFSLSQMVGARFFDVFGVEPEAGRYFLPEDDSESRSVAVISYPLWRKLVDPTKSDDAGGSVVGSTITVNTFPFTVIGVAPEGFSGSFGGAVPDLWVPFGSQPLLSPDSELQNREYVSFEMTGRLAPGVDHEEAAAFMATRARQIDAGRETVRTGVELAPIGILPVAARAPATGFMAVLLTLVGLILAITSVNVAGMLLARAVERRREIAVRLAIGAGRARLVRQLVTESFLLFAAGGVLGTALAHWASQLFLLIKLPIPVTLDLALGVDTQVLIFTLAVTLAVGLFFGLLPALQATRVDLVSSLKEGGNDQGGRLGWRRAFVIAQVAGALVLLIAAGLFLRALQKAVTLDPGFNTNGVRSASVDLSLHNYSESAGQTFYADLMTRLRQRPGVDAAGLVRIIPLGQSSSSSSFEVPGAEPPPDDRAWIADANVVDPGYFETLQIPMVAGRAFTNADSADGNAAVIVNQALADRFWPEGDAVGRTMTTSGKERRVVGVAANGKYRTLGEDQRLAFYLPLAQRYSGDMTIIVRGEDNTTAIALREEIAALDAHLPTMGNQPYSETIGFSLLPQRLASIIAALFGGLGLVLVTLGIYGVVAFMVSQRTREIGVRVALGADRTDILRLVLGQGLGMAIIGSVVGLAVAFGLTRLLSSLLYGVSATDTLVFAGTTLLVMGVAVLGSLVPAWRATRIEVLRALRYE